MAWRGSGPRPRSSRMASATKWSPANSSTVEAMTNTEATTVTPIATSRTRRAERSSSTPNARLRPRARLDTPIEPDHRAITMPSDSAPGADERVGSSGERLVEALEDAVEGHRADRDQAEQRGQEREERDEREEEEVADLSREVEAAVGEELAAHGGPEVRLHETSVRARVE